MSLSLERLRLLRGQATGTPAAPRYPSQERAGESAATTLAKALAPPLAPSGRAHGVSDRDRSEDVFARAPTGAGACAGDEIATGAKVLAPPWARPWREQDAFDREVSRETAARAPTDAGACAEDATASDANASAPPAALSRRMQVTFDRGGADAVAAPASSDIATCATGGIAPHSKASESPLARLRRARTGAGHGVANRAEAIEQASTRATGGPDETVAVADPAHGVSRLAHVRARVVEPTSAESIAALRRLLGVRERLVPSYAASAAPADRSLPGIEIAPGLRLIEEHLPFAAPESELPLAFARREDAVDPRRLLFFDTETTGLSGGTGTRAFMIGAADWHRCALRGEGLRIRQLMITTLGAEPAMLSAFAQWLRPDTVLSSYNGRCYDAPLLTTRYRLARTPSPLAALDHVDLLFPTRRRYRGVWENCRLATIERELLRIVREDDLPGSQAPAAWLRYLRGGSSEPLRRVVAHNRQDVVTLARLMLRLVEAQEGQDD